MKTSIYISGQVNGNSKLRSAIITAECKEHYRMFNAIELEFPTKKAAKKALWDGFKSLKSSTGEKWPTLSYSAGSGMRYDASTAAIIDNK